MTEDNKHAPVSRRLYVFHAYRQFGSSPPEEIRVVAINAHEALALIDREWSAMNGGQVYDIDKRCDLHWLPLSVPVPPIDQGRAVACWSSRRIDDYVAGIGDGQLRDEEDECTTESPGLLSALRGLMRSITSRWKWPW